MHLYKSQPVLIGDLFQFIHIRFALAEGFVDLAEEFFEASRGDGHEHSGGFGPRVFKAVGNVSRGEYEFTLLGEDFLVVDRKRAFTFNDVKSFVFVGVYMRRRTAAGRSDFFGDGESPLGFIGSDLDVDGFAEDVECFAFFVREMEWIHRTTPLVP